MENQNVNATAPQGGDMSDLKKMFSDYQKQATQKSRRTSAEILAKYFVPRATKEIFRVLPPKPGRKRIEEAFFHVVTTNGAGGKKKHGTVIYCPAHNDAMVQKLDSNGNPMTKPTGEPIMTPAPCPLCAKAKKILAQQDPSLKGVKKESMNEVQKKVFEKNKVIFTDASKWEAKKFYIARGIDRGQEKDGVKFWRFKHNFKNQGTLDKLLPILELFMTENQADFSSAKEGTDLNIIMTDTEFNGHTYKQISAITARGKSLLHADPIVAKQWLEDDITWRDVFLPKKAPNITPYEFLEMVTNDTTPYWDDIDQNNKHWVFPGRPDLETAANTRRANLDADAEDENFEHASDMIDDEYPRVTPSNITAANVGTFSDDAVDVGKAVLAGETEVEESTTDENLPPSDNYDDLPF
jgi:glutaredoxin